MILCARKGIASYFKLPLKKAPDFVGEFPDKLLPNPRSTSLVLMSALRRFAQLYPFDILSERLYLLLRISCRAYSEYKLEGEKIFHLLVLETGEDHCSFCLGGEQIDRHSLAARILFFLPFLFLPREGVRSVCFRKR